MNQRQADLYVSGALGAHEIIEFETELVSDPDLLTAVGATANSDRLNASMAAIAAELDTPKPTRLERAVRRLAIGEPTARLVAATPAFRRSFVLAIILMTLFAAAGANSADGTNRLLTYLTLAPAIPLLGTALAFGRVVDPMHEVTLATPIDGFRLVMVRTVAVYAASIAALVPGSIFIEDVGAWRWAWLLPGLMLTTLTLALSTRFPTHLSAAGVGSVWIAVVTAASTSSTNDVAIFEAGGQLVFLAIAIVAAIATIARRHNFDGIGSQ